jgi:hypothetical protein
MVHVCAKFGNSRVRGAQMKIIDGFLVLSKRRPTPEGGAEVFVSPTALQAIEPHNTGCYVYVAGQRWDVAESHEELLKMIARQLAD